MPALPDSIIITRQLNKKVLGKEIIDIRTNKLKENEGQYNLENNVQFKNIEKIVGRKVSEINANMIKLDNDFIILIGYDNGGLRYYEKTTDAIDAVINKHKTATFVIDVEFADGSYLEFIINNWTGKFQIMHFNDAKVIEKMDPSIETKFKLSDFQRHFHENKALLSVLTTANGIMDISRNAVHEVLYKTKLHPKTKASSLGEEKIMELHENFIKFSKAVTDGKGTAEAVDIFGNKGHYEYSIGSQIKDLPCPVCGETIIKDKAFGSTYYYCPGCQIKG